MPVHVLDHYRNTSEHIMKENNELWALGEGATCRAKRHEEGLKEPEPEEFGTLTRNSCMLEITLFQLRY